LERPVKEYNFKGGIINGHIGGRYLDDDYFWPILERAQALNASIYLHPTPLPQSVVKTSYAGNYPPEIAGLLASAAWGWHIETAIHISFELF
jgi:predicted TIM-barrel fold metal-dependent hydrolase